jgi:hypothetical protein
MRNFGLDRYRALLRDADDEPKRLALIQLLIDERVRDKFGVEQQTDQPEQQVPAHPDASSPVAAMLEGDESTAPKPLASEDVVSLIDNLLSDKPAPPVSKPPAISRTADIVSGDEFEKEITSLLKGLSRTEPSIASTSGNEEKSRIATRFQAALEIFQLAPK